MATTETILGATIKAGVEHFGGFPSGTMIAFAGKSVPDGWLLCNGALVSRTTYAKLFAAIGTAWGAGDGSTTFKLPDADGRVMQGVTDASKVGQYLKAGLPNITGGMVGGNTNYQQTTVCGAIAITSGKDYGNTVSGGHTRPDWTFDASRSSNIYGASSTVQASSFQTLIIIKVGAAGGGLNR